MDSEGVYAAYFDQVYRFLLGLSGSVDMAEELTQETFARALRHSGQFSGRCQVSTWLCSIARNCYVDHCRRKKREIPMENLPDPPVPDFTDALLDRDRALRIHRALQALEEPYKEVFSLRVFGELEHREIGALFGKSENWARVTYYRARMQLQQKLREE